MGIQQSQNCQRFLEWKNHSEKVYILVYRKSDHYLEKGNWEISKCMVMVKPRIQFSTRTRTAKKGTTLKIQVPDEPISVSCSSSKVTFDLDKNYIKIKCLKKGTATITLTVNKNGTYKDEYHTKKTYRFNVNVK